MYVQFSDVVRIETNLISWNTFKYIVFRQLLDCFTGLVVKCVFFYICYVIFDLRKETKLTI